MKSVYMTERKRESSNMCSVDGEGLQTGHLLDTACLPACVRETTCPRCADLSLFFSSVSAYFFADLPLPLLLLAAPQFINIVALSTHHMFYHPNKLPQWQLLSLVCLGGAITSDIPFIRPILPSFFGRRPNIAAFGTSHIIFYASNTTSAFCLLARLRILARYVWLGCQRAA